MQPGWNRNTNAAYRVKLDRQEIMVKTIQAQTVISAATNISPLDGGALTTAILPATDGAWATLVSDGTNWIIMQRGS